MKKFKKVILSVAAVMAVSSSFVPSVSTVDGMENVLSLGVRGDYNGDGSISVMDLMRLSQYLLGTGSDPKVKYETDINGDGKINIVDFTLLKSAITKNIVLWNMENTPVMDGSTSEIQLETGFKEKMLGISYKDAGKLVSHHDTDESFKMLLSGENDLIFASAVSETQRKEADKAGVRLYSVPFAKEGLVFAVNKDNPVDALTQEQIKDIYSGKITNWKELGGNDEKIIPYQRNTDSGSQNYMKEFMNGADLIDAPKEEIYGTKNKVVEAVAAYDNASGAIGYSLYSYAAQIYENSDDVKLISVDGVKPSGETMADSTYPLLSESCIIYTDSALQNTLDFVDWAVSEEGQLCALENGYIPVTKLEYPDRFKAYAAKGTGEKRAENYKPDEFNSVFQADVDIKNADGLYIDFLKDKDFQKTVNEDIGNALKSFELKNTESFANIKNGYMNIVIKNKGTYDSSVKAYIHNSVKTFNYNLKNNTRLEKYSDLFYKNENFVPVLNNVVSDLITNMNTGSVKTDFTGLTGSIDDFSLDYIYINDDNPYFTADGIVRLSLSSARLADGMVCSKYFDNTQILDEKYCSDASDEYKTRWDEKISVDDDGEIRRILKWSPFYSEKETEQVQKILDKVFEQGKELNYYADDDIQMKTCVNDPVKYSDKSSLNVYTVSYSSPYYMNPIEYYFDAETGEMIQFSDIFGKDFEIYDEMVICIESVDLDKNTVKIYYYDEYNETDDKLLLKIYPEKINMKYINAK